MGVEKIVFLFLIIFALFSILSRDLKHVILGTGVFSLLASFLFLLYHAPDVAVAEAVIGSTLGTILYLVALRKYERPLPSQFSLGHLREVFLILILFFVGSIVIYLSGRIGAGEERLLFGRVMELYFEHGERVNPVAAIYLDYRMYDTVFEALMLLVSVLGVIHLSRHEGGEPDGKTSASES